LATQAQFNGPGDVTVDPSTETVYVSDTNNNRVRSFPIGGNITTFAGNGQIGQAGLGGPALAANITTPQGIVFDPTDRSVYVGAAGTRVIMRIDSTGIATIAAGVGLNVALGDGGPAVQGNLKTATMSLTQDGTILIGDNQLSNVRAVDPRTGLISTILGNGIVANSGGDVPALSAPCNGLFGTLQDATDGSIYVCDRTSNAVRRIDTTGFYHNFAGTGAASDTGNGGPALQATLNQPHAVALSTSSRILYVCELGGKVVRSIPLDTTIISTVAGGGTGTGENIPATSAAFGQLQGIAVDPTTETIYASDNTFNCVRAFQVGGKITTVAGIRNQAGFSGDGGPATAALMSGNTGVGLDPSRPGVLYICDTANRAIRRVDQKGIITTVMGTPGIPGAGPAKVLPTLTSISTPFAVAVDPHGNIFVSDQDTGLVYRFGIAD